MYIVFKDVLITLRIKVYLEIISNFWEDLSSLSDEIHLYKIEP